ncbi:SDR family NAD(P)-dependent oxidoreductase [Ponticoccus alexandrii]|uniref:SDR family oxidoreductase n=1 Tax=Ponticoccus alexandrii TaxID=1943633 RepID=A0ABX7FF94_9RHOB|nr:SDR family NAD(P)-dependent oxidoreductase [Ponticoccus alexandrii]ETA51966.1 3-oxoacyl-ACP reductase [Rhodobacteraceae bacterium PD-2]QRF69170.1 SDR family oxidoreductase [Ponticoccus alexandrii]
MPRGLNGRTAIVTGAAGGIGHAIAARLAGAGAKVEIWDWSPETFDGAFTPAAIRKLDVSDPAAVAAAFESAVAELGQVDILVNNAGINGPVLPMWELAPETWASVLGVNLTGVFNGCRVAAPHMKARGYGRILNIASMAGKDGVPYISAYSAAKAGVIGFSKAISKELADSGVTVNCIAPAMAETGLQAQMTPEHIAAMKAKIPMGRFLKLPEIADMAAWIVSEECSFTTGFTFDLSGGRSTY